ncbi:MAG: flagellar hook-associated protein FlgL [bacterium]
MVDRISTKQIYNAFHQNIFDNQSYLIEASNKINTGIKFKSNYDDPRASSLALNFEGQILNNDMVLKNRGNMQTELELAENSLGQMKDKMDKVKELILTAANASTDPSSLDILKTEIRSIGQALMQLGNTKSGGNYIFAGKQSNLVPFELLDPSQSFSQTIYKEGLDNGKQKDTENIQTSFDIKNVFLGTGSPALVQGIQVNPTISTPGGNLDLTVNDGTGGKKTFSVALSTGDNLVAIRNKINTAFTAAGGSGTVAEINPPWQLQLNTSLITPSSFNNDAKIDILKTSNNNVLNDIGFSASSETGEDIGSLQILNQVESALTQRDKNALRLLIKKVDDNNSKLLELRSKVGLTLNKLQNLNSINQNFDTVLQTGLSRVKDIDFLDTTSELNNAQARLSSSIETASNFFRSNLSNFLGG